MVIASKPNNDRHFLSFSRKLFLSVISLFLVFAACFIAYQYQREKEYKVELLDTQLQDYNERLQQELRSIPDSLWTSTLNRYIAKGSYRDLRVTIVNLQGRVLYDSYNETSQEAFSNHIDRQEVQKALKNGKGYDLRRTSETTGIPYFYSATLYPQYIIRSALPYDVNLVNSLAADPHYLWFTAIVTLLLIFVFYKFTSKLGTAINHLREFAKRADKNEPVETDIQSAFPHNELGEISQHIIQIYKRLRETKEALYIEREKLITHLQTSREGLGVFTKDKKEILVNNLFTQYGNLISDSNLQTTEEIFSIYEFQKITDFISKAQRRPSDKEEKRLSIERCYAQSNRLSRLLRDISVLTRMDEAANMIDMEKVDISMLVTNIVNEVSLELEEKHITVVNGLHPKIQLKGNYSLLYSIFRNLMDNAMAYAGTNIYININCFREDENFYYFSFADTGVGVSPEHLNRLFERFYRVDKGRSRKLGGTGLGLAIVKNAVIIHGGTISAKNNQGGGLEFVFTLAKEK